MEVRDALGTVLEVGDVVTVTSPLGPVRLRVLEVEDFHGRHYLRLQETQVWTAPASDVIKVPPDLDSEVSP